MDRCLDTNQSTGVGPLTTLLSEMKTEYYLVLETIEDLPMYASAVKSGNRERLTSKGTWNSQRKGLSTALRRLSELKKSISNLERELKTRRSTILRRIAIGTSLEQHLRQRKDLARISKALRTNCSLEEPSRI